MATIGNSPWTGKESISRLEDGLLEEERMSHLRKWEISGEAGKGEGLNDRSEEGQ